MNPPLKFISERRNTNSGRHFLRCISWNFDGFRRNNKNVVRNLLNMPVHCITGTGNKINNPLSKGCLLYTSQWSAQDCMSPDGVPYIGHFARKKQNWYVATGFGKWGMSSSMVSAKILSNLISGHGEIRQDIFYPRRELCAEAMIGYLKNGLHTVKDFSKYLIPKPRKVCTLSLIHIYLKRLLYRCKDETDCNEKKGAFIWVAITLLQSDGNTACLLYTSSL